MTARWLPQERSVAACESQWLSLVASCSYCSSTLQTAKVQSKKAVKGRGKEPVKGRGWDHVRGRGWDHVRGRGWDHVSGRGKRGPRPQDADELEELAEGARLLKKFKAGKVPVTVWCAMCGARCMHTRTCVYAHGFTD